MAFKTMTKALQKEFDSNCRPEFLELRDRDRKVYIWEWKQFSRMNSWERQCLIINASPQLLVHQMKQNKKQFAMPVETNLSVPSNYEAAFMDSANRLLDHLDEERLANPIGNGTFMERPVVNSRVIFYFNHNRTDSTKGWLDQFGNTTDLDGNKVTLNVISWRYEP